MKNYDPLGIKLFTRLRFGFSHFSKHKFKQNFVDTLNPLCYCSLETESTLHFCLHCQNYTTLHRTLTTELININNARISLNENNLLHVIMYGNNNMNIRILTVTNKFIKDSERFDQPLF